MESAPDDRVEVRLRSGLHHGLPLHLSAGLDPRRLVPLNQALIAF